MKRLTIGWDVETHLIQSDDISPPLVCVSLAGHKDSQWLAEKIQKAYSEEAAVVEIRSARWVALLDAPSGAEIMRYLLYDTDVDMVAHNGAFDWTAVIEYWGSRTEGYKAVMEAAEQGRLRDTFIREKLICLGMGNFDLDYRLPKRLSQGEWKLQQTSYSLAGLARIYKGPALASTMQAEKKDPSAWRLRYKELDGVPLTQWPKRAINYAIEDAWWTLEFYRMQGEPREFTEGVLVDADGNVTDELSQVGSSLALFWLGDHGALTDREAVEALERENKRDLEAPRLAAREAGFLRINSCKACDGTGTTKRRTCVECGGRVCPQIGVPPCPVCNRRKKSCKIGSLHTKRLKELVTLAYHPDEPPKTDKGHVSTATATLEQSGHPLLQTYAKGSFARRMESRYIPDLKRGFERPVCDNPNTLVSTGRTSWRHQQPPREGGYRPCFIPRPGKVFASIDYAAIELAALSEVCLHTVGYSKLGEEINEGIDPHLSFAVRILQFTGTWPGVTYPAALKALKNKAHPRHKEVKGARQVAKAYNFGIPGGTGVRKFIGIAWKSYGIQLDFDTAKRQRQLWFEHRPAVRTYLREYINSLASCGSFRVRQLGSNRLRHGCTYTSGANTYFQGLAADGGKAALWALTKEMYTDRDSPLFGVRAWGYIHDEVLFEGPEETAHLWAPHASKIMVAEMQRYIPNYRVSAEPALMRRWEKDAEPVYDNTGRLVVWTRT